MSGNISEDNKDQKQKVNVLVQDVMKEFNVDEKTANHIIVWSTQFAKKKLDKWYANVTKALEKRYNKKAKTWTLDKTNIDNIETEALLP
jgi:arsenate reductase-like glutaredoxin family protein